MKSLQPGEVEVIVIAECSINGPDHRTLGRLNPGDRVITHQTYVQHLLDAGLICMPEEFDLLDLAEAEGTLADLDAELAKQLALITGEADPDAETVPIEALPVNIIEPEAEGVVVTADAADTPPTVVTATAKKVTKPVKKAR